MSKAIGFGILGVLGVVCIIGASVFLGLFPGIIKDKINEELPLKNGSDTYDRWQIVPVPIKMKFNIFVLQNHDSYHNLSDIKLVERGPYTFEETRVKQFINYTINENKENLVSYQEHKVYKFLEKESVGPLSETVTFVNLPFLGVIFNKLGVGKGIFEGKKQHYSNNEKALFTNRTVGDLLFDGFNLTIFDDVSALAKTFGMKDLENLNPFSISNGGRDKLEEQWTIHTGIDSMDKYGQIYQFDGKRTLTNSAHSMIWKYHDENATTCNALKGTDGTMFKPSVSKKDVLYAFEPQLCRSVYFYFGQETSVREIDTYRFWVPKEYFQSPNKNKENSCYCPEVNVTQCTTNGLLDISNCMRMSFGGPVIMSAPYFNHGDKELRDKIHLKSEKEINDHNYGTFLDIEPMTGTVLKATRRIQINIEVEHYKEIEGLKEIEDGQKIVVPVLWLEESAEADEKQADEFKSMVLNKKKLGNGISIAVIVVGALMTITAIVLYIRHKKNLRSGGSREIGAVAPHKDSKY